MGEMIWPQPVSEPAWGYDPTGSLTSRSRAALAPVEVEAVDRCQVDPGRGSCRHVDVVVRHATEGDDPCAAALVVHDVMIPSAFGESLACAVPAIVAESAIAAPTLATALRSRCVLMSSTSLRLDGTADPLCSMLRSHCCAATAAVGILTAGRARPAVSVVAAGPWVSRGDLIRLDDGTNGPRSGSTEFLWSAQLRSSSTNVSKWPLCGNMSSTWARTGRHEPITARSRARESTLQLE